MSFANPTPVRVGARGAFHGWRVRVAGRVVMGVTIDGETYHWQEFHLVGESGNTGTLVFEETEHGPEWKLFRLFEPAQPLPVAEAAAKRVGDTVNLDGTPTRVTLVGQSRVYHLEGEPPEGVEVGDVSRYFNADTGRRMLVASWSGDEIEFYEGEDVPAALVRTAFGLPAATPASFHELAAAPAGQMVRRYTIFAVVGLFGVLGAAVFLSQCSHRSARGAGATPRAAVQPAPALQLPLGASGRLGSEFTITGSATVTVARVNGRYQRREYALRGARGEMHVLVQGLSGQPKEWHVLQPIDPPHRLDPYQLAVHRRNAWVDLPPGRAQVGELFRTEATAHGGSGVPPASGVRYGFTARSSTGLLVARWNEAGAHLSQALPWSEAEVLRAFQPAAK